MPDVGLIGIGLLGGAIAERLLASGWSLIGFDLDASRTEELRSLGGTAAESIGDVVRHAPVVILSLPDSRIVAQATAEFPAEVSGTLVIDTTTGDPESAVSVGRTLADRGLRYVEATVVGSSQMLRQGEAVVLLGGADDDVAAATPFVEHWGRQRFHVGLLGSAAVAKLVTNLVLGLNRAVLAEGLNLAQRSGLDGAAMLAVLRSGLAYSRVMDTKGRRMLESDFAPEARLRQHHKDVRLILELGAQHGAPLPLSALHERLLSRAEELGFADADNSAIIRVFQEPQ